VDVRFSAQALFCQITRSELERLAAGLSIDLIFQLPKHRSFRVSLRPSSMSADRGGWQLDSDPTGIWLTVPRAELEPLGQTTTLAERLVHEFAISDTEKLQVFLEALPDQEKEDRTVLEITPAPDVTS
jgi:hypothetical protein